MRRPYGIALFLFAVLVTAASRDAAQPGAAVRTIPLSRVIQLPLNSVSAEDSTAVQGADTANLAVWRGAEDEPPEGPDAFDVLDDGSLLLSDPLRSRISVFDSEGKFRQAWQIGFAADSIRVLPDGVVLVREAKTGQTRAFDREGRQRSGEAGASPAIAQARLLPGGNGVVTWPSGGGQIDVRFDRPGSTLVSLESIASNPDGTIYIALESTDGHHASDAISVNKFVRKYSADGKLICETENIPLDYYIAPVDELRAHKGMIYQLMTTSSEVRINIWDMN